MLGMLVKSMYTPCKVHVHVLVEYLYMYVNSSTLE